jgi:hypothetical protein
MNPKEKKKKKVNSVHMHVTHEIEWSVVRKPSGGHH